MSELHSVSIVIPVHNEASTCLLCFESIERLVQPVQIIIVDDASTDATPQLARQFADKHGFQLICLEKNSGAAAARNIGARAATGDILFFLDGDIALERDTVERIRSIFGADPTLTALFGSYQKNTVPTNFVSVYKNLLHHYTHQISSPEAATFCSGYGAIRRDIFFTLGGFNEKLRALEDIEFGYRLYRGGYRTRLVRDLYFTHLKRYSLSSLVRSDVLNRAIPWTRLMLERSMFRNDLNTKSNNVASVVVAFLFLGAPLWVWFVPFGGWILLLLVLGFLALNLDFLLFVTRERGVWFGIETVAMTWLNYIYSGVGLLLGLGVFGWEKVRQIRA